jgi:hypothetical protein
MVAADRMPVLGMRVPRESPAAVDVAVVVAPPDEPRGEDRTPRADPAPELVAVAVERVQPAEHAVIFELRSDGLGRLALQEI